MQVCAKNIESPWICCTTHIKLAKLFSGIDKQPGSFSFCCHTLHISFFSLTEQLHKTTALKKRANTKLSEKLFLNNIKVLNSSYRSGSEYYLPDENTHN